MLVRDVCWRGVNIVRRFVGQSLKNTVQVKAGFVLRHSIHPSLSLIVVAAAPSNST